MNITIVGSGYVGLVSGTCFAECGHAVTCLDLDEKKIALLQQGRSPIYEPGLDELLRKNIEMRRLQFTTSWDVCIASADVIFIAVGTPTSRRGNGYADMSYVYEAAQSLALRLHRYTVIVNKSTVPVGSARQVERLIREVNPQAEFDVASNPEFLREGAAIQDFLNPDRVVLGVSSERAWHILQEVYRPLGLDSHRLAVTSLETAELVKYASNAFLATKISFINEIANLCEVVGADIQDVARGMGLDSRIGPQFLHAGPGYGGSCFPKDTLALIRIAQEHNAPTRITEVVAEVNNAQKARMVGKIVRAFDGACSGKTLAVLGLAFKPETDDMREAASMTILPALTDRGMRIRVHDPVAMEEARKHLPDLVYCQDAYDACNGADAVCLMTEWNPYRSLDLVRMKELMKSPVFIDLRNVYDPEAMEHAGYRYVSVGRSDRDGRA
ncbi:MAG: UDP-glucose/GDP-mannose dehydrogenase family protein [Deltaproteobacteria bacterium]|nr:UDP-glucose/GDP-mannose dehydrogenase family protein [Deltaproteobacteria bacterium]